MNRFSLNLPSGLFLTLWLMFGILSYLFGDTRGMIYSDSDVPAGYSYISDLQGTAGNDNLCIQIGAFIAFVGVVAGLVRLLSRFSGADLITHGLLILLQATYIIAIERGSILVTITHKNIVLALWAFCYLSLVGYWVVCLLQRIDEYRNGASLS